jgi:P27 family predicted phage terminase small subunit
MTKTKPKPPQYLKASTRRWFRDVVETFDLEPHHVRLLTLAAEAWDRVQEAREMIATAGAYFNDRFGCPKAHPAVAVERDSRIGFARLLRELALDVEPPRDSSRPPGLGR